MLKKTLIGLVILGVASWLWVKTELSSYARTAWGVVRSTAKSGVPVEFEIKRAKHMLATLDREADSLISAIASQMIAIERLERDISQTDAWLEREAQAIRKLNEQVKNKSVGLSTREEARLTSELEQRYRRLRLTAETQKSKRESLERHRETLAAAREQLDHVRNARHELYSRIEKLEVDLQIVKAAEARSRQRTPFDDSQLGRLKELVDEIEKQIQTRRYEVQLREGQIPGRPSTSASAGQLTQEIDEYFSTKDGQARQP
ncbi:MAG: hypothetical protein C4297_11110 [Gemmataceae bacterium]